MKFPKRIVWLQGGISTFLYKLICILKENTKLLKIYTRGEITKINIIIIMESGGNNRSLIVILVGSAQLIVNVVTEI